MNQPISTPGPSTTTPTTRPSGSSVLAYHETVSRHILTLLRAVTASSPPSKSGPQPSNLNALASSSSTRGSTERTSSASGSSLSKVSSVTSSMESGRPRITKQHSNPLTLSPDDVIMEDEALETEEGDSVGPIHEEAGEKEKETPRPVNLPAQPLVVDNGSTLVHATREQEAVKAWQTDGHKVYKTIPKGFTLTLDLASKSSRRGSNQSQISSKSSAALAQDISKTANSKASIGLGITGTFDKVAKTDSATEGVSVTRPHLGSHSRSFARVKEDEAAIEAAFLRAEKLEVRTMSRPLHKAASNGSFSMASSARGSFTLSRSRDCQTGGNSRCGSMVPGGDSAFQSSSAANSSKAVDLARARPGSASDAGYNHSRAREALRNVQDMTQAEKDEEYEERRHLRFKRKERDLKAKIQGWLDCVVPGDTTIPEIEPTPPTPSLSSSRLRLSPFSTPTETPLVFPHKEYEQNRNAPIPLDAQFRLRALDALLGDMSLQLPVSKDKPWASKNPSGPVSPDKPLKALTAVTGDHWPSTLLKGTKPMMEVTDVGLPTPKADTSAKIAYLDR